MFPSARPTGSRIPARWPWHIVEVRTGTYLAEDDIVRYEDSYGREGTSN